MTSSREKALQYAKDLEELFRDYYEYPDDDPFDHLEPGELHYMARKIVEYIGQQEK